jgi:FtsP/CotA-like multicopper oxidase with cupredoxin domain
MSGADTAAGEKRMSRTLEHALPVLLVMLSCLIAAAAAGAADSPDRIFDLTIARGALPAEQRVLRVNKGDTVRLRLTSDAPGEIHLHGYRLEAKLVPGVPGELVFKAYATGRYRLEWHPAGEPGKSGGHHGPPPATLEVRPR